MLLEFMNMIACFSPSDASLCSSISIFFFFLNLQCKPLHIKFKYYLFRSHLYLHGHRLCLPLILLHHIHLVEMNHLPSFRSADNALFTSTITIRSSLYAPTPPFLLPSFAFFVHPDELDEWMGSLPSHHQQQRC